MNKPRRATYTRPIHDPHQVSYRAWDTSQATTHTLILPAAFPPYDPWSPYAMAEALNVKAADNGHPADLFDLGGAGLGWGDMTTVSAKLLAPIPKP